MRLMIIFAIGFILSGTALGQRYNCSVGLGATGFQAGYRQETNYLDLLWDLYGDCGDYDPFIENLDVEFSTSSTSTFINCRNLGLNHALSDKMVAINQLCGDQCHEMGREQGELNAKIFCGVAQQHTRYAMAASLRICDQFAAQACKQAFDGYVNQHCGDVRTSEPDVYARLKQRACNFQ